MQRTIKRAEAKQVITAKAPVQHESVQLDQVRIDKWIRDRLVDWRDSCGGAANRSSSDRSGRSSETAKSGRASMSPVTLNG